MTDRIDTIYITVRVDYLNHSGSAVDAEEVAEMAVKHIKDAASTIEHDIEIDDAEVCDINFDN